MKIKISRSLYLKARKIHLYAGLVMIPFLFVFGLSGFLFNHSTYFHGRASDTFKLEDANKPIKLLPDLNQVSNKLTDYLIEKGVIEIGSKVYDVHFEDNLVVRSSTPEADFRLEFNLSNNHARLLSLPDFAETATIDFGKVALQVEDLDHEIKKLTHRILKDKGIEPGETRIQRMPFLTYMTLNGEKHHKVGFNIMNGNYYVDDMTKKGFKLDYFLLNLHQEHGYPIGEWNAKTVWVFFADFLSILLMIWAVTGIIMWLKIRKELVLGTLLLVFSLTVMIVLVLKYNYLGY